MPRVYPVMRRSFAATITWMLAVGVGLSHSTDARADNDPILARAVQYLRANCRGLPPGDSALVALALIKADVRKDDEALQACVASVMSHFSSSGYTPVHSIGMETYEIGVVAVMLSNLNPEGYRSQLQTLAGMILSLQKPNGSWDYTSRDRGDTSISQYALLGLWEASNGGAKVPPAVWDRAAEWYLSVQGPEGSWNYHRDEPHRPETISMTAAGVGSLLICQRQLKLHRRGPDATNPLLLAVGSEPPPPRYVATTSNERIDKAVERGIAWLGSHFKLSTTDEMMGLSVYYGLYGVERVGGLAEKNALGSNDWFEVGRQFLATNQKKEGSWNCGFQSDQLNTSWALLFLTRSTAKTLRRIEIKRLGAGTLLGGRGLPKDLSSMTVAGGRVVSRPMNGAVENMLAVLEDPRATEDANSAVAGIIDRYQVQGPKALKPFKDRFRAMIADRDPGLRRVACWCLARMGELDVAPLLIDALADPDDDVVTTAAQGLQILSRKIDGFGPPPTGEPEARRAWAKRWRDWYQAIRPLDLEGQDDDLSAPSSARARSAR